LRKQILGTGKALAEQMLYTVACPELAGYIERERFRDVGVQRFLDVVASAAR
jgi:hypothetical protein